MTYGDATFHVAMRAHESAPLIGDFTVDVKVDGYGLGCLHADVHTSRFGLRMCTMVMPTAIGPNRMQFRQLNRIAFDEPGPLRNRARPDRQPNRGPPPGPPRLPVQLRVHRRRLSDLAPQAVSAAAQAGFR